MPSPIIENFVQFTHLNELYGYPPSMYVVLMAWVFGLDLESYREVKGRFGANAREASRELIEDPAFAGRVNRLPFRAGYAVVGNLRGYRRSHRRLGRRDSQVRQLRHRMSSAHRYPHQPADGHRVAQGGS
jgi:hypothetical protein